MSEFNTSASLLGKLGQNPTNQIAWQNFANRYGPLIQQWCVRWGMKSDDGDEIAQNVMLQLSRQMAQFNYDRNGSFRSWLKTVTYRAWCDFVRQRMRQKDVASGDSDVLDQLKAQEAEQDLTNCLENEWKSELMELAMAAVQKRIQSHTWEAFRLSALENLSGADVADKLGMKVGAVWVAKSKVIRMIRDEIGELEKAEMVS